MDFLRLVWCLPPVMFEVLKQSFMRDLCYRNVSKLRQYRTIKAVDFVLSLVFALPYTFALVPMKAKLRNSSQGVLFLLPLTD